MEVHSDMDKNKMKNLVNLLKKNTLAQLASLALIITVIGANTVCWFVIYQEELPLEAEEFRKE